MNVMTTILARGGSTGLPRKNALPLLGKPVVQYTIEHAQASELIDTIVLTTDSEEIKIIGRNAGIEIIDRPKELATATATVDSASRHAVETYESRTGYAADVVVILYGNVPVRKPDVIDRAVSHLIETKADSVRTLASIGKNHPDWLHRLDGDRMIKFRENDIYRRQDLEPLYYHDGCVIAVTRKSLFTPPAHDHDFHAFFGKDRRAIIQSANDTVDIDSLEDFYMAEAMLRMERDDLFLRPTAHPAQHA
jgi:N-acylneuraminate cytidylyltransferase